ncbi:hypothetical protein IWZ00DRAFT_550544 [Phyllosticta capitalensis]
MEASNKYCTNDDEIPRPPNIKAMLEREGRLNKLEKRQHRDCLAFIESFKCDESEISPFDNRPRLSFEEILETCPSEVRGATYLRFVQDYPHSYHLASAVLGSRNFGPCTLILFFPLMNYLAAKLRRSGRIAICAIERYEEDCRLQGLRRRCRTCEQRRIPCTLRDFPSLGVPCTNCSGNVAKRSTCRWEYYTDFSSRRSEKCDPCGDEDKATSTCDILVEDSGAEKGEYDHIYDWLKFVDTDNYTEFGSSRTTTPGQHVPVDRPDDQAAESFYASLEGGFELIDHGNFQTSQVFRDKKALFTNLGQNVQTTEPAKNDDADVRSCGEHTNSDSWPIKEKQVQSGTEFGPVFVVQDQSFCLEDIEEVWNEDFENDDTVCEEDRKVSTDVKSA